MLSEDCKILMTGWEAKQNQKGVVYFANDELQLTSWNHPCQKTILDSLDDIHGEVKYAAYRTSLKLRALQCQTGIQWMNFTDLKMAFAWSLPEYDKQVSHSEVLAIIQRILETSDSQHQHEMDIPIAAELILSLMMTLYDVNREGKMMVRSVRNALTALSTAKLSDKYKYFFMFLKGANQRIHRQKLTDLMDDLIQITEVMKESAAFGNSVTATVESCFMQANNPQQGSVSEENFYAWLLQEPQTLVWLPTLHRVLATEEVEHDVRCSVCRRMPLIGFRYRCLQCLKYDLCQNCFLHGQTSLTHKLKHQVKEYCFPTSARDNTKALLQIIKNKLSRKSRNQAKIKYLPVESGEQQGLAEDLQSRSHQLDQEVCNSNSTDSGLTTGSESVETGSQSEEDDSGARLRNRPVEVLGHPCDTSSPVVGGSDQSKLLSKQDIDCQQKHMVWKIEQLQRENRALQEKLATLQKHYDIDLSDHHSDTDEPRINYLSEDPMKEITTTSPISPIATDKEESQEMTNVDTGDNHKGHPDILDIVGSYTPVRPNPSPSSPEVVIDEVQKLSMNPEPIQSAEALATSCDITEYTVPNGLRYRLSDMSLDFSSEEGRNQAEKKVADANEASANETSSNELVYRSSDMSLDFLDTVQESKNPETNNQELSDNFQHSVYKPVSTHTHDIHLEDNLNHSFHGSNKSEKLSETKPSTNALNASRKPCLIYSSNSLKQKMATNYDSTLSNQGNTLSQCSNRSSENEDHEDTESKWTNPFTTEICSEDGACPSVELSEIFPHNSHSFKFLQTCYSAGLTPTQVKMNPRRNTLEPVHMSTPVRESQHLHPKSAFLIRHQPKTQSDVSGNDKGKENRTALSVVDRSMESSEKTSQDDHVTSQITVPSLCSKRTLVCRETLISDSSTLNYDPSKRERILKDFSGFYNAADKTGNLTNEDPAQIVAEERKLEKLELELQKMYASLDSSLEEEEEEGMLDYLGVLA